MLVVGAGPAGLEAALAAARRGYEVHLAEATSTLGGRVAREAALPGPAEWARVRDWRVGQLERMANVSIYRDSPMDAASVMEFAPRHIVIATGAAWRRDGVGRAHGFPIEGCDGSQIFTPDDIMAQRLPPAGPIVIFDDDHYAIVSVTARLPGDGLYADLAGMQPRWSEAGIVSVTRIGDCHAPGTIQAAVYAGHKLARGLDEAPEGELPRELPGSPPQLQSPATAAKG